MKGIIRNKTVVYGTAIAAFITGSFFATAYLPNNSYEAGVGLASSTPEKNIDNKNLASVPALKPPAVHINAPESVKGIYMTACVAGTPSWRENLTKLIETTELNSVVIDIKDYSGTISIFSGHPLLEETSQKGCRVSDMDKFISTLHERGIYVIGRITVFQDPYYAIKHPELAVKKESDGGVWKDYKGLSFIDVSAKPYWEYIVALSKESYQMGFDELNFDYIRFPSDGNMKDIDFSWSRDKTKAEALREFFSYLHDELKSSGVVISADLFGMTATNFDDLNIGQILEYTLPYFDYIDPMVYPSHYPSGFNGYKNVNANTYNIVKFSLDKAVGRTIGTTTTLKLPDNQLIRVATGTLPALYTKESYPATKIRPWLQDFNYPVTYTPEMVKSQIQATYDAGLTSWLLWDPANKYTPSV